MTEAGNTMWASLNHDEVFYLQNYYHELVAAAGNVFFVTDEAGFLVYVNSAVEPVLGFAQSEIVGKHFTEVVHPDWLDRVVSWYTAQFRDMLPETTFEFEILAANGERRWVEQIVRLMIADDKVQGCNGLLHDITARKQAEAARQNFENGYLIASENSGAIVFIVSKDTKLAYTNPAMERATGYSRNELIGMSVLQLIHPDYHAGLNQFIQSNSYDPSSTARQEIQIIRKDGSICWLDVVANWGQIDAASFVLGSALDVTERKHIEEQLKASQFFIERINRTIPDLIYVLDLDSWVMIYTNHEFGLQLGYGIDEINAMGRNAIVQLLHPDEVERYRARIEELRTLPLDDIHEATFRMRHKDGSIRWVQLRTTVFERSGGMVKRVLGIMRDITEQFEAENAHRLSQTHLHKSLEYQRAFNEVNFELGDMDTFDGMCRRAIELGQSKLGFDRIGLLLYDHKSDMVLGTYGVDVQGNIRDEREVRFPLSKGLAWVRGSMRDKQRVRVREDVDLYDNLRVVGHGWNAMALMWKDGHVIGWLAADNLMRGEPLQEYQLELLGLLAIALEHFCVQKGAEKQLKEVNRRYDQLATNMPVMVYRIRRDPSGKAFYEYVSPRCKDLTGFEPHEVLANADLIVDQIVPEDRARYDQLVIENLNNPQLFRWEGAVMIQGERRWRRVESHPYQLEDGSIVWDGIISDITETKRSEEALRQSEERYRAIVEQQRDLLTTYTPDTRVTFMNEAACRIIGRRREEVLGQSILAETPLEYHSELLEIIRKSGESGESFVHEHPIRLANGKQRWFEWTDTPIYASDGTLTAFQSVGRDIDDRKRTEDERNEYITRLEVIRRVDLELTEGLNFDHVLQIALDAAIRISRASAGAIHLLEGEKLRVAHIIGNFPDSVMGQTITLSQGIAGRVARRALPELITDVTLDPDYLPNVIETRAQMTLPLVSQDRLIGVLNVQTSEPNVFTRSMFDFLKVLAVRIASALDNARLHYKTEQQVIEMTNLYQQVSELEQLKTQMIRIAAHDLRNPLGVISGYIQMLEEELAAHLTNRSRDQLQSIRDSITRIDKITRDILTLERIAAGREMAADKVDLTQMVTDAFVQIKPQAVEKQQEFSLEKPAELVYVTADRYLLPETMINLLTNAIKYTPHGGKINVRLAVEHEQVVFTVQDNGYGIPEDKQDGLFQAFYRVKTKETKGISGTGLGLHLVKTIIERHKGAMRFQSVYGKGSLFGFELPLLELGTAPHGKRRPPAKK